MIHTELYLVRHGQSRAQTGEDKGPDPELSLEGLVQANALGDRLRDIHFDYIFSSHLSRAIQTAAAVAYKQKDRPAITVIPELSECGTPKDFVCDPTKHFAFYDNIIYEGFSIGKDYESEQKKAEAAFRRCIFPIAYEGLMPVVSTCNEGKVRSNEVNVLIAAHGMYDAYILGMLANFPFDKNMVVEQHNTCINHLSLYTVENVRRCKLIAFNDYHHLDK